MRPLAFTAVAVLLGCSGLQRNMADPTKRDLGTDCASNEQCPATTTCVRGRCEYDGKLVTPAQPAANGTSASCTRDEDCPIDQLCIAKFCEPKNLVHQ
jgi:hypothetical protein